MHLTTSIQVGKMRLKANKSGRGACPVVGRRGQATLPDLFALLDGVLICLSPLCNLRVLCVSVVKGYCKSVNHRDTENTEVAQRNQIETVPFIDLVLTARSR